MITVHDNEKYRHTHFDTVDDLLQAEVPSCNADQLHEIMHNFNGRPNWFGIGRNSSDVLNAVRYGWKEGYEKARVLVDTFEVPRLQGVRRRKKRGAFGNELDIHRVYSGNLDTAWTTTYRETSTSIGSHSATVVVELATSSGVEASAAFWRGAAATMLVDMLQQSGRNVRVIGLNTATHVYKTDPREMKNCQSVILKDYLQPLDMDLLMTCTSVGFNRTLMFKAKMVGTHEVYSGLGHPVLNFLPEHLQDGSRMIRVENIWSRSEAERKLAQVVQEMEK